MCLSMFYQILALGSLASFSRWIWRPTMPLLAEEPDCQGKKISSCQGHLRPLIDMEPPSQLGGFLAKKLCDAGILELGLPIVIIIVIITIIIIKTQY